MKSMRMAYMAAAAGALSLCALPSCDVHEFPAEEPESHSVVLHLEFRTEMPLHQTVEYTRSGGASTNAGDYDIRYQIRVYRTDNEGEPLSDVYTSITETKDDVTDLNHSVDIEIEKGNYRFLVWADYVDNGGDADKFYTTGDFKEITLAGDGHCGNNAFRDAFRGETVAAVTAENGVTQEITVEMERPLARFQFVTTDLEELADESRQLGRLPHSVPLCRLHAVGVQQFHQQADRRGDRRQLHRPHHPVERNGGRAGLRLRFRQRHGIDSAHSCGSVQFG